MSTDTFSNHLPSLVDSAQAEIIAAVLFLTGSLMNLAGAHPSCSGRCPGGDDSTCGETEDRITEVIPYLAGAVWAVKETIEYFGQRLREPESMAAAERADLEQALVDVAVDLDTAIQALRVQGRRLEPSPAHRSAALTIENIVLGLIPAATGLGDLIEVILS